LTVFTVFHVDFDRFKSNILSPDSYVEEAKDLYDAGYPADECPRYMVTYDTLHNMCKEQQDIVHNSIDLTVLSSAFRELPRLAELSLDFCQTVGREDWLESYLSLRMTTIEKSHEHHVRVVSSATQRAKDNGISLRAIHLFQLELPYYHTWEVPDLGALSGALRELLGLVAILRLRGSDSPLELLSHRALNLRQFDMCDLTVEYASLKDFLESNSKAIRSVGFHDVQLTGLNQLEAKLSELSPELLCSMLNIAPESNQCRATDCICLPAWKKGWRLLFVVNYGSGEEGGQNEAVSATRK
jgi:hypothetical protein